MMALEMSREGNKVAHDGGLGKLRRRAGAICQRVGRGSNCLHLGREQNSWRAAQVAGEVDVGFGWQFHGVGVLGSQLLVGLHQNHDADGLPVPMRLWEPVRQPRSNGGGVGAGVLPKGPRWNRRAAWWQTSWRTC